MKKQFLLMTLSAFLGAIIAILLIAPSPLEAQGKRISGLFEIYNKDKQRVAIIGEGNEAQGTVFLFDERGNASHQLGTYGAGSEKGQPVYGMHDRQGAMRTLMRLYGPSDSPVLVMKDKAGYDKLVIGLRGDNETPYIQFVDNQGQTRNLLDGY